jgi:cytochrome c peroxidase
VDAPRPDAALVALGRELYLDPALSQSGTRACATCHLPERAFTDGRARALLLEGHGGRGGARNTPTLVNAALQPTLFADGRVRTLEDQTADVLGSPGEMGGSLHGTAEALRRRPRYAERFARVLGGSRDGALTPAALRNALAAYVRSLTALDSRFDRAARGDSGALTPAERRGFTLFMGKARCGTCHFAPLFNGATPPALWEAEPEVIGVPARAVARGARVDPDSGRYNVRRIDQHLHAFKTPTLRNVALTAPYMHNGVFPTLEAVVDFYDAGGGAGIGARLGHQTLPPDSLRLTRGEKRALVAFLGALTDTAGTTARP